MNFDIKLEGYKLSFKSSYDKKRKTGYLCEYFPYGSLRAKTWRHNTWSPEILNYKEGEDNDIKFFVEPFSILIKEVLNLTPFTNNEPIFLVPIPTSIVWNKPEYNNNPRKKGDPRNRDNRNIIFCQMLKNALSKKFPSLTDIELIRRVTRVKTKDKSITAQQHKASMKINNSICINNKAIIILIDDIITHGNTINGAKLLIQEQLPATEIICLAISRTTLS
ncbi:MAG: hypothetical protein LBE20_04145 [Deltaproteobacteria bacterium]|jgi:hypothetical protein|nr:hypothetical protein [Deltaproteobacteria bacterium]